MVETMSRADVEVLVQAALAAADPERLVREFLTPFDFSTFEKIFVLGVGKAGGSMALGVEEAMRGAGWDRVSRDAGQDEAAGPNGALNVAESHRQITDGLVVVKDGYGAEGLERVGQVEAAHPIPDGRGADAARSLLELAGRAGEDDLVICLISGGGSALTALPAPGLSLEDLQQTVYALLRSGAEIGEVNAVRKHLTMAAAGRLAEASYPAKLLTLIVSDVIGDALDVIASGPTVPDESSFGDALAVLERYSLMAKVPPAIIAHLQAGAAGEVEETPKPGDEVFARVENHILASNRTALMAAADAAEVLGYAVLQLDEPVTGEARDAADRIVALTREQAGKKPGVNRSYALGDLIVTGPTGTNVNDIYGVLLRP